MTAPAARRRFTLADAMVLVAATALGMVPARQFLAEVHFNVSWELAPANVLRAAALAVAAATPCAATWTLALLPLRLRSPRPDRRRLVRQAGFVAAGTAGLIIALGGSMLAAIWSLTPQSDPDTLPVTVLLLPLMVGPGVAASRLTLWMVGRRRPAADWIDRWGRVLGWFWILAAPVNFYIIADL